MPLPRRTRWWRMTAPLAATVPLLTLLSSPAIAATLCVKPGGGGGCQATINAALAAAQNGDTVRVAQGTYVEFVLLNKGVVLEGGWNLAFTARDPAVFVSTIRPPPLPDPPPSFDPTQTSVVRIDGPAAPTLDGFTITGGRGDLGGNHGGGVSVRNGSAAVLRGNVITGNSSYLFGGGVWIQSSSVRLERNRIEDNTAVGGGAAGGGLNIESGAATVTSNVIAHNHVTGASSEGGGVVLYGPGVRFVNNTVDANDAEGVFSDSALTFSNNVVTGHLIGLDLQTCPVVDCASATVTFNDFFGNTTNTAGWTLDGTNRLVDPLLTADHHLLSGSPMIDAGTRPGAPAFDIDGQSRFMAGPGGLFRPDIGADEYMGPAQRVVDLDTEGADLKLIGPGGNPSPSPNGVNDWIGFAALAADVNGDGRDDLVTSAEDWAEDPDNPPRTTGRLFGVFNSGLRATGTRDLLDAPADLTVACTFNLQHIGSDLVSGDLDGNGLRDLVVGSFQDDGAGGGAVVPTVYVFRGGPALAGTRTLGASTPADFTLRAPGQDFFAFSDKNALATGDVTGDGVADLLVGDALANHGAIAGTGAVFVMIGGSGLAGLRDLAVTPADYTLYGSAAAAGLGTLAVGRVNAGAQLDLVARTDTAAYVILGPLPGPGPTSTTTAAASITITGLQAPNSAGGSLLVADVTGDGADDIVLASGNDLLVVPGPLAAGETFDAASRAVLTVTDAYASALASADLTGDGKRDLIVGARQRRQAFVVAGGSGFTGSRAALDIAVIVVRSSSINNVGWDVSAGDLDFDSRADLVVTSWTANVDSHPTGFTDAGLVFVIYGKPSLSFPSADVIPDFDADEKADVAVYHQSTGLWFVRQSTTATSYSVGFGGPGYRPVPGDYDGDGHTDVAVYHQSSGLWFIRQSTTATAFSVGYGGPGYDPVQANYDGDGKTDIAVYHPSSGLWFVRQSTTGTTATTGYGATGYSPVPRDYDGDGKADIAVYHESSGLWFIRQSTTGTTLSLGYGGPGLSPHPRDYDGDGKADLAVYYPPNGGIWYVRQSSTGTTFSMGYGGTGYTPVPADYDGDGKADIAVYHGASGQWFIRQSTTETTFSINYGGSGYTPVN